MLSLLFKRPASCVSCSHILTMRHRCGLGLVRRACKCLYRRLLAVAQIQVSLCDDISDSLNLALIVSDVRWTDLTVCYSMVCEAVAW
jgi:hypothetical protein